MPPDSESQTPEVPSSEPGTAEELEAIVLRCASLPELDDRSAEDIVGYDQYGIPA